MSYKIVYGDQCQVKEGKKRSFGLLGVVFVFALWMAVFSFFFPKQACNFREKFFPFTSPVTKEAFSNLTEELRGGIPFEEAVQAFCMELIYGAEEIH